MDQAQLKRTLMSALTEIEPTTVPKGFAGSMNDHS
jgi:hypothetical protein